MPIAPDGVDFSRIKKLAASEPATAERMLRLGLSLCDPIAAQAVTVTKLRGLLPELRALLDPSTGGGGGWCAPWARPEGPPRSASTSCARRTRSIPATDWAPYLVPLLADRDRNVRMSAAMGARRFRRDGITKALLETVRRDKSISFATRRRRACWSWATSTRATSPIIAGCSRRSRGRSTARPPRATSIVTRWARGCWRR